MTQDLQALTLKEKVDKQKSADTHLTNSEVLENNNKAEEQDKTSVSAYKMTKKELHMQEEEEKYDIYTNTVGYERDNSNLDHETETESQGHAYPLLD